MAPGRDPPDEEEKSKAKDKSRSSKHKSHSQRDKRSRSDKPKDEPRSWGKDFDSGPSDAYGASWTDEPLSDPQSQLHQDSTESTTYHDGYIWRGSAWDSSAARYHSSHFPAQEVEESGTTTTTYGDIGIANPLQHDQIQGDFDAGESFAEDSAQDSRNVNQAPWEYNRDDGVRSKPISKSQKSSRHQDKRERVKPQGEASPSHPDEGRSDSSYDNQVHPSVYANYVERTTPGPSTTHQESHHNESYSQDYTTDTLSQAVNSLDIEDSPAVGATHHEVEGAEWWIGNDDAGKGQNEYPYSIKVRMQTAAPERWEKLQGFVDSANPVGNVITLSKVLSMGYSHADLDDENMIEIDTENGREFTCGSLDLIYRRSGGKSSTSFKETFHVVDRRKSEYDVHDIWFGTSAGILYEELDCFSTMLPADPMTEEEEQQQARSREAQKKKAEQAEEDEKERQRRKKKKEKDKDKGKGKHRDKR